ncbi:hypothetical protein [Halovenus sp. HT40]|uniref:hypothetical protein n=1 Tax=Halovenus sp. HT40 TaxID=3126691 RepID=UPI00300EAF7D
MAIDLTRRRLLRCAGAGTLVGLAGCTGDVTEGEPRASAVYVEPADLDAPVEGTIEATVMVHNVGISADIEITVEAVNLDADPDEPEEAITESVSFVESFDRDEQRTVTTEIEPGPLADGLLAQAGPAD